MGSSRYRKHQLTALSTLATVAFVAGACGITGSGGSPSTSVSSAPATATAPAGSAKPTASSKPTPAPTTSGTQVVENFTTKVSGGNVAFKESQILDTTITPGSIIAGTGDFQVGSKDYAGTLSLTIDGKKSTRELAYVGGKLYAREDGGAWVGPTATVEGTAVNAFVGVTSSNVTYLGTVSVGGQTLYKLDGTKAVPLDLSLVAPNLKNPTTQTYSVVFNVKADGTPVSGRVQTFATGTLDGASVKIESYTDWTFADFGAPITIKPPA
jgi:hypothetical protein